MDIDVDKNSFVWEVFIMKTMINFYFSLFIVFFCILPNRRDKFEEFVRIKNIDHYYFNTFKNFQLEFSFQEKEKLIVTRGYIPT